MLSAECQVLSVQALQYPFGESMFTGIIEEVGRVAGIAKKNGNRRLTVSASQLTKGLKTGESIAVSGVCLTALDITFRSFAADLADETWTRTSFSRISLSRIKKGALVNLELPMRADGRFGGHIVQGHVDGTGKFLGLDRIRGANDYWLRIEIPPELARYVIFKGSLCIEGISLTIARIEGTTVTVAIIPHTVKMTNLRSLKPGDPINLEVDMVAKYVEKMMKGESANSSLTVERLVREGF
jgi:riboflavin synthase